MGYCQEENEKQETKKWWAEGHCQRNLGLVKCIHIWLIEDFVLYKNAERCKKHALECTLDVLCHLYQTQMLLVASVFAAPLLFIFYIFNLLYFSV